MQLYMGKPCQTQQCKKALATIAFIAVWLTPIIRAGEATAKAFVIKNTQSTFDEAKKSCEELKDGRLVGIHNQEIQWKVAELVKESGDTTWIWIGMNGTADRTTMKYDLRWLDGTPFYYNVTHSNFHSNVLNNRHRICCAMAGGAWVPLGMWIDISCNEKRSYICEYMPDIKCSNSQECPECLDKRTAPDCRSGSCSCKALCKSPLECPECGNKEGKCKSCVNGACECKVECASNDECPGCYLGDKKYPVCVSGKCLCNALPNPKTCTSAEECDEADCTPLGKIRSCQSVCDCEVERTIKEFVLSNKKANFAEAVQACQKLREGQLAMILNEKIQTKVVDMIHKSGDKAWIWIGMNGTGEWAKAKYSLNWLDGTEFNTDTSYSKFHKNVFNRKNKLCCAIAGGAWTPIGTWLDIACSEKRRYICEYMPEIKCTSSDKCPTCLDTRTRQNCLSGICVCKKA